MMRAARSSFKEILLKNSRCKILAVSLTDFYTRQGVVSRDKENKGATRVNPRTYEGYYVGMISQYKLHFAKG